MAERGERLVDRLTDGLRVNGHLFGAVAPLLLSPEEAEAKGKSLEQKMGAAVAGLAGLWENDWLPEIKAHQAFWDGFDRRAAPNAVLLGPVAGPGSRPSPPAPARRRGVCAAAAPAQRDVGTGPPQPWAPPVDRFAARFLASCRCCAARATSRAFPGFAARHRRPASRHLLRRSASAHGGQRLRPGRRAHTSCPQSAHTA
jgi:hypothetical protein